MTDVLKKYESIVDLKDNNLPIIFLFHGTGADNTDLIPIAKHLNPTASIISVNGNVFVNGARRYFDRNMYGVDVEDLKFRAKELATYLEALIKEHQIEKQKKIAIGYSNGANIIIGMLQQHTKIFDSVGLLHGAPYSEDKYQDVSGLHVYVSLGENDQMIDATQTMKMVKDLDESEAKVTVFSHQQGHHMTTQEIDALKTWFESI